jgi:hypothetical protein
LNIVRSSTFGHDALPIQAALDETVGWMVYISIEMAKKILLPTLGRANSEACSVLIE